MTKNNTAAQASTEAQAFDFGATYKEKGDKSKMIRHMASLPDYQKPGKTEGSTVADIGKINKAFETAGVKMRYQHVRNVLNTPLKG